MTSDLFLTGFWLVFKVGLIIFGALYFIFTLLVMRQVKLMTDTVTTEVAPGMRALSVFYSIISLLIIALLVLILF